MKHLKLIIHAVSVDVIETTGEPVDDRESSSRMKSAPRHEPVKAERPLLPEFEACRAWRASRPFGARRSA